MIIGNTDIQRAIQNGDIVITPYNRKNLNPNSYDVTLAPEIYRVMPNSITGKYIDSKKETFLSKVDMNENGGFVLEPNKLYLGRTVEKTHCKIHVPMIEGVSSYGRIGVFVHVTAGFGDVGFDGFWTLEIVVVEPTIIYPNHRIAQIYFNEVKGCSIPYHGKYNKNEGIQTSKLWTEFNNK